MSDNRPEITINLNDLTALMCHVVDHRIKEFKVAVNERPDGSLVLSWQLQGNRIVPLHRGEALRPVIPNPSKGIGYVADPDEGKTAGAPYSDVPLLKLEFDGAIEAKSDPCIHLDDCARMKVGPCTECTDFSIYLTGFKREQIEKAPAPKLADVKPVPKAQK